MSAIVMLLKVIAIILYGAFALFLVSFVRNHAQKSIYKWLTVIFVILLPTWDVVLGKIVYYIACRNFAKVAIYETVETDGIYYEGVHDYVSIYESNSKTPLDRRTEVGLLSEVFKENYTYAEAKVTKRRPYTEIDYTQPIPAVYYRCTRLPADPQVPQFQRMSCVVVDQPKSRYMLRGKSFKIATVTLDYIDIVDRKTGRIMAEKRSVLKREPLPFFYWLFHPFTRPPESTICSGSDFKKYQKKGEAHFFEYYVLKPKQ